MRRSIEDSFLALRQKVKDWALDSSRPDIWVFVYPPEWEAAMLARFPAFARTCAEEGWTVTLEDVGQGFLHEVERRKGLADRLVEMEHTSPASVLHDLGVVAGRYISRVVTEPLQPPSVCRILVNTGALGTFSSYSAITNQLLGDVPSPSVLAFPGEGDDRSLNLLRLRVDTNYRVPRV